MKIRYAIHFGLWIGATAGAYVWLYLLSPLAPAGVIACTFVALPIFLNAGGKLGQIPNHVTSAIAGVAWALLYLKVSGTAVLAHVPVPAALGGTVFILTAILCAIHSRVKIFGLFSNIPAMFGGIACTFLAGGEKWAYIMVTMCLGIVLGYINISVTRFLDEDGHWLFGRIRVKNRPV